MVLTYTSSFPFQSTNGKKQLFLFLFYFFTLNIFTGTVGILMVPYLEDLTSTTLNLNTIAFDKTSFKY